MCICTKIINASIEEEKKGCVPPIPGIGVGIGIIPIPIPVSVSVW